MPVYFFRPENALNRANEFIEVGKKDSALDVLSDIIRSKKHRQWSETHESIIQLYLKLCVELQKSPAAKDGLYQYRNICKDTNLHSFHVVIDGFLTMVEEKAAAARKESEQTVLDIEDLDMVQTPESLLLSTVSGEDRQDRTDRIVLTPWVKFLWESFRNILELLKNNTLMEKIYALVAKRAFGFCLEYKRRTEFHKLCDILRTHLRNAQEHQLVANCLKFDNPETIQYLVEVRFEQLDKAISIDLWQEAFRAIEDIHALISGSKHKAKASLLENFYQKQASVYWMANNKLFHAAALFRLFVLRKEQKRTFSLDSEEAKRTACHVLLATLSVPIRPIPSEIDRFLVVDTNTQGKSRRLADLLRMQTPPTRASLLKELSNHGIIQCVSEHLQQLYSYLEVEFDPLVLCSKVEPLLAQLEASEETKQYVEPLKDVTLIRLVKQVSQIYQSIQLTRLCELARFADPVRMERLVVETAKTNEIPVRIDHNTDSFWFGADLSLSQHSKAPEGPVVQSLPSELFCDHISVMAQALQQAAKLVFQKDFETKLNKRYSKVAVKCKEAAPINHKLLLKRSKAIEERKEYLEGIQKEKEKEEKLKQREEEREIKKRKQEKLDEELKEEQEKKKKKEMAELEKRIVEDKLEALKQTVIGAKVFSDMTPEELKDLDTNMILKKQLLQMEKEKKDKQTRLKGQEKKIDHTERAKRLVEIPKRKKEYAEQIEADRKFHETMEEEKVQKALKQREEALQLKERLGVMEDSKKEFMKLIKERRNAALKEKMDIFEAKLNEERQKRLEQRALDRKKKRKAEAIALKAAEEEKKARELAEAERAQKDEERRTHLEKMEQQRQIQLQREKEVEEKQKRKEEERMKELKMKQDEQNLRENEPAPRRQQEESWRRDSSPPPVKRESYRPPQKRAEGDSWRSSEPDRRDDRGGTWDRERSDGGGNSPWSVARGRRDREPDRFRDDRYRDRPSYGGDRDSYRSERDPDRFRGDRDSDRFRGDRDSDRFRGDRDSDRFRGDRDPERFRGDRDSDRFRGDRDSDRFRGDRNSDRFRGDRDSDRYRGDRDSDQYRPSNRFGDRDSDRYRGDRDSRFRSDRDGDRFRSERESDRYRGPERHLGDRGGGDRRDEWRRSPEQRGFDRSPRRDEGRWRTDERRRDLSPRQKSSSSSNRSPHRKVLDVDTSSPQQKSSWRSSDTGGDRQEEGWEKVTRKR